MVKLGSKLFFRDPKIANDRVLIPATLVALEDEILVAQLEPTNRFGAGQELTIFYEIKREFVQQPVQLDTCEVSEAGPLLKFFTLGDPVSAESRQYFRVATIAADLRATIGDDSDCGVQDVSATGFAALVPKRYLQGARVSVSIEYGDTLCEGEAVVQSVCERRTGYRFGFLSVDAGGGRLQAQLNEVSLSIQREQLRRLSGASLGSPRGQTAGG